MQRSLRSTAIAAAALGLAACAAPGDAFAPRATMSSDRAAAPSAHSVQVTGGGTTTFGADLDGDGDIDGSHFGFAAVIADDGSAQGHFTCLMAGNADFLGLHFRLLRRCRLRAQPSAVRLGRGAVDLRGGKKGAADQEYRLGESAHRQRVASYRRGDRA